MPEKLERGVKMIINRKASDFRKEAREALNGKWGTAILISLIYAAIIFVTSIISSLVGMISSILSFIVFIGFILILPPLIYGTAYAYYHLKNGEKISPIEFLKVGFLNLGRSWKISLQILKKCWWCILIIILPTIIGLVFFIVQDASSVTSSNYFWDYSYDNYDYYDVYSKYSDDYYGYDDYDYDYYDYGYDNYDFSYYDDNSDIESMVSNLGGALLSFLLLIAYLGLCVLVVVKSLLYALTFYIAVSDESISPKEAVLHSEELMRGNRGKYFCLILSFFGWALLAAIAEIFVSRLVIELFSRILVFTTATQIISRIMASILSYVGTIILTPYISLSVIAFYQELERMNDQNYNNMNLQPNNAMGQFNNTNVNQYNNEKQFENANENENIKICMNCGKENSKDSEYCTNCGNKI